MAMAIALVGSAAALVVLATTVEVMGVDELRPERIVQRAASAVQKPECSAYNIEVALRGYATTTRELEIYRRDAPVLIERRDASRSLLVMCDAADRIDRCYSARRDVELARDFDSEREIASAESALEQCLRGR